MTQEEMIGQTNTLPKELEEPSAQRVKRLSRWLATD
jgi:hypothetical protein